MAPVLEVDIDALNADGVRFVSLGHPFKPSNCAPPGSDAVSLGAARALNEHEMGLIELLDYATRVREYGGAVIKSAAVVFELADRAGAESIHRVDNTNAPPIATSSGPLQMPVLPSIGGEQFSADLHSGPGPAGLRDFSRAWHNYGRDITRTADDTRSVGMKINEHWSSGDKAAHNIMDHAKWLDSAAAWAERLSVAAEAVTHAFDIAKQDTPTPDEFSDAESDVMEAAALMAVSPAIAIIEYQRATSRYADLVAKAEEAAKRYHASVNGALTGVGNPLSRARRSPVRPTFQMSRSRQLLASRFQKMLRSRSPAIPNTPRTRSLAAMAGVGVRRDAPEDAFNHPVRDVERLIDNQGRMSFKYTGENATVVVNAQGKVITGWANNRSGTPGGTGG